MTVTLDELIAGVTIDEAKESIYSALAALEVPVTSWKQKSVVRAIVYVMAAFFAAMSTIVVLIAKSGIRSLATGDWKTLTCYESYGVERTAATFASGNVTLANGGGGIYTFEVGELTVQNAVTKVTFHNTAAFTLAASSTATVAVIADEAGASGTSTAGSITTMVTALAGVTCTNSAAFVGTDGETDEELDLRTEGTLDAISPNGAAGAYLAVARTATLSDGTNVGVNRVATNDSSSTGAVVVTCATASGALDATELDAVEAAILTGESSPVPLGIATCTVQSAVAQTIACTAIVYVYTTDGRDETTLEAAAVAALDEWISSRPIGGDDGGYVYRDGLASAILSISPYAFRVVMSVPSTDTAISAGHVPVPGTHSVTVYPVTP